MQTGQWAFSKYSIGVTLRYDNDAVAPCLDSWYLTFSVRVVVYATCMLHAVAGLMIHAV